MRQKLISVLMTLLALIAVSSCEYEEHPTWTTPELNTSDIVLQIGQTAVRQGVSKIPGKALEYTSSNPSVATVDQNGLITALNVGETTITVNMPYPEHPNHITSASFLVKVVAIPAEQLKDIDKATPLTLVADEDGFIIVTFNNGIVLAKDIHYSINNGPEQTIAKNTEGEYKIAVSKGDFVQFWSTNTALGGGGGGGAASRALTRAVDSGAKYINIRPSMKTEIYGNVMSLLKGKDNLESATTIEANNAFYGLFAGAEKLVNNTERLLVLPATTLTEGCYQDMFNGCKGIEKAPELPAPKLEKNCYQEMFYDCAKLNSVKCLATDVKAENSTKDWLGNAGTEATGPKVLETATDDLKPNSDDGVPTSWTAQKIVLVESVTLGKTELALVIGEADVTLTATVKPENATDPTVTWTSSNPAVATVTATTDNTKGTVHAVAPGEATITAQAGDKTATCKVTVTEKPKAIDLSTVTENITVEDGLTVTGKLAANVKISIADGATVTLDGITIMGVTGLHEYEWAGINCLGDATIILKDGTENTVKGFNESYPGILIPSGKTLTIKGETKGTGTLSTSSNGEAAGIGGGWNIGCGNINIEGGVITATGGQYAAGIGGGFDGKCGNIMITSGVTSVTATKGNDAPNSIGIGAGKNGTCGTVTIGGKVYWDGESYQNGGDTYLTINPIIYPAPTIGDVTPLDPFKGGGDPLKPVVTD